MIKAIRQYSENYVGENFDDISNDDLETILRGIASGTDFTAEELVESLIEGF